SLLRRHLVLVETFVMTGRVTQGAACVRRDAQRGDRRGMRAAVHPRPRPGELLLVIAIIAGGTWLRWVHLEAPSLWWDELVHVRIADQPTVSAVWRAARDGAAPGTG